LKGMTEILRNTFDVNLADGAEVKASSSSAGHEANKILRHDADASYWTPEGNPTNSFVEFDLREPKRFDRVVLQEDTRFGQRVEEFQLEYKNGDNWTRFCGGTTIGYKRLLRFPGVTAQHVRLVITRSRANPNLCCFGLYKAPPALDINPAGGVFVDSMLVMLSSDDGDAPIEYFIRPSDNRSVGTQTADGTSNELTFRAYSTPFFIGQNAELVARIVSKDGSKQSPPVTARFIKAKHGIELRTKYGAEYTAGGAGGLVDGLHGSKDFHDGRWQGYEGNDMDVVIDLGARQKISKVTATFLQNYESWIFFPMAMTVSVSQDNEIFAEVGTSMNDVPPAQTGVLIKSLSIDTKRSARYVRVQARNVGVCPEGHPGAGQKAWLFVDEIEVE